MEILERLEELGNRYNSHLIEIGKLLGELADQIDSRLPDELGDVKFEACGLSYWRYGPRSNIGRLGPAFWIDGELVSTTRTPGSSFYLYNDFNCLISVADRATRREAAKKIKNWMEEFIQFLEEASEEISKEVQAVQEVLDCMKNS